MREQLSFDHALRYPRHPEVNVAWWAMQTVRAVGSEGCSDGRRPPSPSGSAGMGQIAAAELSSLLTENASTAILPVEPKAAVASRIALEPKAAVARIALGATGLTRSFVEVAASTRARLGHFFESLAPAVHVRRFGVRPANDSWAPVIEMLGEFTALEVQAPCRPAGAPLPSFFTCQRGRVMHRLDFCTVSFVQMMCDLGRLERLIAAHEVATGAAYDFVTWIRLDVAWESALAPALPVWPVTMHDRHAADTRNVVWLPNMNSQRDGMCDKFAFGGRRGMAAYLHRGDLIDLNFSNVPRSGQSKAAAWRCAPGASPGQNVCEPKHFVDTAAECTKRSGCMLSLSSERFLSFALYRANVTIVRMRDWNFCKFGNSVNAWGGCTARIRSGQHCNSLECPSWMSGGCKCLNTTCKTSSWYCSNVK